MNPGLIAAAVGHLGEQLQQVKTHHRRLGKILGSRRTRPRCAKRGET